MWGLHPPSTNRALPCTRWGAYRPPADFPMLALRARGVPKLTSGYATGQSHSKFGETAGIQYACNALLVVCWARVHKVSCWNIIKLDHVLDLEDNLFKHLGLNRYSDAFDLSNQIVLEDFNCKIDKLNLHNEEATIYR